MINVIIGTIGSGKTLLLTLFAYLHYLSGGTVYANYHLKFPHTRLEEVGDFLKIKTKNNFFALDEFWLTADSRRHSSLMSMIGSRHVMQSRKTGKVSHVFITAQSFGQLDKRIRNNTTFIFEPEVKAKQGDGKPLVLEVEYYNQTQKNMKINRFHSLLLVKGKNMCDLYDTFEIVDDMGDGRVNYLRQLIEKYADFDGKKTDLKAKIIMEEAFEGGDIKTQEADIVSTYIKMIQKGQIDWKKAL